MMQKSSIFRSMFCDILYLYDDDGVSKIDPKQVNVEPVDKCPRIDTHHLFNFGLLVT